VTGGQLNVAQEECEIWDRRIAECWTGGRYVVVHRKAKCWTGKGSIFTREDYIILGRWTTENFIRRWQNDGQDSIRRLTVGQQNGRQEKGRNLSRRPTEYQDPILDVQVQIYFLKLTR
jgi:hypothetical protein